MRLETSETCVLFSKDLFGESIDATLDIYRNSSLYRTFDFKNGIASINIPQDIEPGIYDLVARREGGEYRINNFFIPLSTHYFQHATTHSDLKLKGGNFKKETWENSKFNPSIFYYFNQLQEADVNRVIDSTNNSNPNSMRWGGNIALENKIHISPGSAVVNGNLINWSDTYLEIPELSSQIGFKNNSLTIDNRLDYSIASLVVDSELLKLETDFLYHSFIKNASSFFLRSIKKKSEDISLLNKSPEILSSGTINGKVVKQSFVTTPTSKFSCKVNTNGTILNADRFTVYSDLDYFLLIENNFVTCVLPRYVDPKISLDWSDGMVFASTGAKESAMWKSNRPHKPSTLKLMGGEIVTRTESNLTPTTVKQKFDPQNSQIVSSGSGLVEIGVI